MGTLFLIGNGFDINCGMNTRYTDVYKGYIKEVSDSENIKKFKRKIAADIENWGDFEMSMARYAKELWDEDELLECLRDFAEYMERYLIEEQERFKLRLGNAELYDAVIKEIMISLETFYSGISHNVDSLMEARKAGHLGRIDAVSFNYTDVFDMVILECLKRNGFSKRNVSHIHGILKDGPVFGIDNIDQVKVNYNLSRRGKRGFIKPIFNDQFDKERVRQAKEKIKAADVICAFGVSLGESDLSWRNEIIDWLRNNESNHLFVYRYNLSKKQYKTVGEKMDIEDEGKEELLSEWGIEDGESIYERIHIPCGKNIFNIEKVMDSVNRKNPENRIRLVEELAEKNLKDKVG